MRDWGYYLWANKVIDASQWSDDVWHIPTHIFTHSSTPLIHELWMPRYLLMAVPVCQVNTQCEESGKIQLLSHTKQDPGGGLCHQKLEKRFWCTFHWYTYMHSLWISYQNFTAVFGLLQNNSKYYDIPIKYTLYNNQIWNHLNWTYQKNIAILANDE